jgi:GGDEF domain-containing protein
VEVGLDSCCLRAGARATALVPWRATEERALRDSLKQPPNTESFLEQAHRARSRAKRRGEHQGILYLDLDGFKGLMTRSGTEQGINS